MCLLGYCLVYAVCNAASAFYVAPNGSDSNNGTLAAPFATWVKAKAAVRLLLANGPPIGGVNVFFRGGDYVLTETVVFGLEDSGTDKSIVTYQSYPGESAVFRSGSNPSQWSSVAKGDPFYEQLPNPTKVFRVKLSSDLHPGNPPSFLLDEGGLAQRTTSEIEDHNPIWGLATARQNSSTIWYVGQVASLSECQQRVTTSSHPEAVVYAWHDPEVFKDAWGSGCYARIDRYGAVASSDFVPQKGVTAGLIAPVSHTLIILQKT